MAAPTYRSSPTASRPAAARPAAASLICRAVTTSAERDAHFQVRRQVFVAEQGLFRGRSGMSGGSGISGDRDGTDRDGTDLDWHDDDPATIHVVGLADDQICGTVRLYPLGADGRWKGDRLAVLASHRHLGLGAPLVCLDIGPLPAAPRAAIAKPKVTPGMSGLILLPESTVSEPEPIEHSPPPDPAFLAQVTAAMDEIGHRADRYSVMFAFRSELASFAALKQAVLSVNCPWFGIDLDPVAILRDTWDMDEVFSQLGPLIRHVRGRDALVGADRRTKPATIGQGKADWPALLHNLDQSGYRGWITIDPIDLPNRHAAATADTHRQ